MTYSRFEDLPVWKEAIRLAEDVYNMTESRDWRGSHSLRDQLQNSDIKGQRHLNEKTKSSYNSKKGAEEFQQELLNKLPPNHPLRKGK